MREPDTLVERLRGNGSMRSPIMREAADRVEQLENALREINRWNDHPTRYSEPLQRILDDVIDTSDTKFES